MIAVAGARRRRAPAKIRMQGRLGRNPENPLIRRIRVQTFAPNPCLQIPINFTPMSDVMYNNLPGKCVNLIDHTIVADPKPIKLFRT